MPLCNDLTFCEFYLTCRTSVYNVRNREFSSERILNGQSFNILHMEGIAGELKRAGMTQNEMKSGEGYSK